MRVTGGNSRRYEKPPGLHAGSKTRFWRGEATWANSRRSANCRRSSARISVGRFGQLDLYPPAGWRVVQDIAASTSSIPRPKERSPAILGRRQYAPE
jgi:hypothetical protein